MIPVPYPGPANEPPLFQESCREPGNAWLVAKPDIDPHKQCAWWREFQPALAEHFEHRCGWLACNIGLEGDVDHWIACDVDRTLSFEWSNYRYCAGTVNSRKSANDKFLDPCEVGEGWFRVSLPDFQLLPTDKIPGEYADRVTAILDDLQLRKGFYARWNRWSWYARHWNNGQPNLAGLYKDAPLVAEAVKEALAKGEELPDPTAEEPAQAVSARKNKWAPRTRKTKPSPPAKQREDLADPVDETPTAGSEGPAAPA